MPRRRGATLRFDWRVDEARDAAQAVVARVPWSRHVGEQDLATSGLTVRCLRRGDGSLPNRHDEGARTLPRVLTGRQSGVLSETAVIEC